MTVKKHDSVNEAHTVVSNVVSHKLRSLPSVSRLLASPEIRQLGENVPQTVLVQVIRHVLQRWREALQAQPERPAPNDADIVQEVIEEAQHRMRPSLCKAINATGVILHTGLGRARLADEAVEALLTVARGHCTLEIDRASGHRGSRQDHVRSLLCELTGAEDAYVVNNCAGAVFLAVTALAMGREVVLSRGELVEIGGGFRMPDIVQASGAVLVEVGTTNRTRLSDYVQAVSERTGLILRCRPSNFAIIGFTETVPLEDLVALGDSRGIPVMDDQGSGALLSLVKGKSTVLDSVKAGASVITASGDKLLGGPQAGLILGKRRYIEPIARHPLARALRVDKLTLAALEATLRLYRDREQALQAIPTLRYFCRSMPEITRLAKRLYRGLQRVLPRERFRLELRRDYSEIGGGSLPEERLDTLCVALRGADGGLSAEIIAKRLRLAPTPIFTRVQDDWVLFDPRTLEAEEIKTIADAVRVLL
ncbi:L-seryl-tRNA(Sec) selenium transferase [Chthonomonas calidirosea]|uniref:L-seryl-tRNA(Sec) selenium transferase n=1 Tax=Chthonomonas calidirosea (strain DSM 23976 / ICMP 18418 / T49) TaxID=1303518 RepID=S0ETN1_CHTCT|nr:L-seryl-tRNA(Sec) selenium transferase [Chthonomonas calidirosea]CCW34885.1 L-seryl-tRNA(Sec) selenium transferase [Chthonomonas calidirosea T49]CEK13515.1 L-seryl-tRNA(Sec) selenium transferase [Chthonomonas calidirosea]